jgi:hypothetical protein
VWRGDYWCECSRLQPAITRAALTKPFLSLVVISGSLALPVWGITTPRQWLVVHPHRYGQAVTTDSAQSHRCEHERGDNAGGRCEAQKRRRRR